MYRIFSVALLYLLTHSSSPFWKNHLLRVPFQVWNVGSDSAWSQSSLMFSPKLTSHQIPGLGVFCIQRPVRCICLGLSVRRVAVACLFLLSILEGFSCCNLSKIVDTFTREFLSVFKRRLSAVTPERLFRNLRSRSPLPVEISTRIRLCTEADPLFLCHGLGILP